MGEQCEATRTTMTATGDVEVRCAKAPGHVDAGDPQHEAKLGPFPVRWPDVVHYNPGWPEQVTPCSPGEFISELPRGAVAPAGEPERVTCPECRAYALGN